VRYPGVVLGLLFVVCAACGGGSADDDGDDDDVPPDAGDCLTPTTPRTAPPELFVGPSGLQTRLVQYIDSAQTTLDLQMYLFTTDELAAALIAAHQRGVALRVLLDPDHEGNPDVRAQLTGAGITVRDAPTSYPFSHAKYMILDGERAVIMSNNFNYTSMAAERNYGIVDTDPADIADLQRVFETDWNGPAIPTQPDLSCSRLIVSPINARGRIVQLISDATSTLDVEIIYLSENTVRTAIIAAHDRGVAVRVILANPGDYPDNAAAIQYLQSLGLPVRAATAVDVHAKLIIADGVAFVGSQNMSTSALQMNREVGAFVFEPGPAGIAIQQFATDWAGATP
jgi:phosphatidylserine/phosphatidylglycerophosphate/cardiolipin synthase-like enzyme